MDDYRLISHKNATFLVVAPNALRFWIGRRATENAPEHFQSRVDPMLLVSRRFSVPLDARNEEDHEDALAPSAQNPPLLARWFRPRLRTQR